jgi:hypothetical protein
MKQILSFLLFTVIILLVNPGKLLAQCSESGANFECYSYSYDSEMDTNSATWITEGTLFWVYVNLQADHPSDSYAFAEVTTPSDYWVNMVTNGDSYQDNFTMSGNFNGSLMLYSSARYGFAYVGASW